MDTKLALESFTYDNDKMMFEMMMKCVEFPSTNRLYGINSKTKVIYTLPEVARFKSDIKDQIILTDPKRHCWWITPNANYCVEFSFIIKKNFWTRDIDNMIKVVQDAIFECLDVNDSRIIEHHNYKNIRNNSEFEYLIVRLSISNYDYTQFNDKNL